MPKRKLSTLEHSLQTFRFPVSERSVCNDSLQFTVPEFSNKLCPAGPWSYFEYDYAALAFTEIDEQILDLTGLQRSELLSKNAMQLFMKLIAPEHIIAALRLTEIGYGLQTRYAHEHPVICMEYNMVTRSKQRKRFLFQFRTAVYTKDGLPLRSVGTITDITHVKPDGTPALYALINNRIVAHELARPDDLLPAINLPLSKNEIAVLNLKAKGWRTKEIAHQMKLKELTVYSMVRNVRQKSGMDIPELIAVLREKGLIN